MTPFDAATLILEATTITLLLTLAIKLKFKFQELQKNSTDSEGRLHHKIEKLKTEMQSLIGDSTQQSLNAIALNNLGLKTPVFLGDWSIDPFLAKFLINEISVKKPRFILELGGGSSTVLISQALKNIGHIDYTHIAVDHSAEYAQYTDDLLKRAGVDDMVEVLTCPLTYIESEKKEWYGNLLERLPNKQIDLLLVDGPPGTGQKNARSPAVPLLINHLAPGALIILDDSNRPDEIEIQKDWGETLPISSIEHIHRGHGVTIFRLKQ